MAEPDDKPQFEVTDEMRRESPITTAMIDKMRAEEHDLGEVIGDIIGALLKIEASIPRPDSA